MRYSLKECHRMGIDDGPISLSMGNETAEEIIANLNQALNLL